MARQPTEWQERGSVPRDPVLLEELLTGVRFAPVWLAPRVGLGWFWLEAGWSQIQDQPGHPIAAGLAEPLAVGLMLTGIALMLGVLTGPAAIVGGVLSSGPAAADMGVSGALIFAAAIVLTLAWKTAGWIGIDRWLLPMLGMPWRGGELFGGWPKRTRETRRRQS